MLCGLPRWKCLVLPQAIPGRVSRLLVVAGWVLYGTGALADEPFEVVVAAEATKVMAGSQPISEIPKGTRLTVSQSNADWYLIDVPGANPPQQGWIRKTDVQPALASAIAAPLNQQQQQTRTEEIKRHEQQGRQLSAAGRWAEAASEADMALAVARNVVAEQPEAVNGLSVRLDFAAGMHEGAEDFAGAHKLREESLALLMVQFGADHWRVTNARLALAHVHSLSQLSADERRQLFEAGKLQSNANVLAGERKYGDAIALAKKAYESCKGILGEDEPFTAAAANRLGFFYLKSGDYRQAEAWSAKTAEVCKRVFGAQHPNYSAVLNNLAQAYFYQRNYDQAEPLFRQALAIRKAGLGERHRETIQSLNSLRELLEKSADQHEAAADFAAAGKQREEILAIQTTVLGPQHWRVANARLDLAHVERMRKLSADERRQLAEADKLFADSRALSGQKKYGDAITLANKVFDLRKDVLGEDDPLLSTSAVWLGFLYGQTADYVHAETWNRKAVDIDKRLLGPQHPDFATTLSLLGYSCLSRKELEEAETLIRQALEIRMAALGPQHADTIQSLSSLSDVLEQLAEKHQTAEDFPAARKERTEILAIETNLYGAEHWHVTDARLDLAYVERLSQLSADQRHQLVESDKRQAAASALSDERKYGEAIALTKKIFAVREGTLGDDDPHTANSAHWLGYFLNATTDYTAAKKWSQKALDIDKRIFGQRHPEYAGSLNELAVACYRLGDHATAEPLLRQALAIRKAELGEKDPQYVASLNSLAELYHDKGDYIQAEALYRQVLAIRKEVLGGKHPDYAMCLADLGLLYHDTGEYAKAEPLDREALAIRKEVLGEKHPDYALSLSNLGELYSQMGDYSQAESLQRQALAIRKEVLGEKDPAYAMSLCNLAVLYVDMGDFAGAEPLLRQAAAIRKEALGEKNLEYAHSLNNLAELYVGLGDYAKADPLLRQVVVIMKELVGERHPLYATSLSNLAGLNKVMGDYAKAEPLYRQSLAIRKEVLGEKRLDYARSLTELADLYMSMRAYEKAEPLYQQALAIDKVALGEKHPEYAAALDQLAGLYGLMGNLAKAEQLSRQALGIYQDVLGDKHPDYATNLNNLAEFCLQSGNDAEAETLLLQALAIHKKAFGEKHPLYVSDLNNLAALYDDRGDSAKGERLAAKALQCVRDHIDLSAGVQSERQQLRMTDSLRDFLNSYVSIAARAKVPAEEIYAQVLAWKGAVSARQQAMREMRRTLQTGKSPELGRLLADLDAAGRELSTQSLVVPKPPAAEAHRRKLAELSDRVERLQQGLAAQSEEFRKQQEQQRRTPEDIRHALPPDTALVDILEYVHISPREAKGNRRAHELRLVAFVVRPDKPIEQVELGPVSSIAGFIETWRKNLGTAGDGQILDPGRELRRLVWEKLEPHLAGVKTVLVSPDGASARFPWPALPGKKPGSYLIEETAIAIVPIPRLLPELLAANVAAASDSPSLMLVGGVDFGADPGRVAAVVIDRGAARGDEPMNWQPLPGTVAEVAAVKTAFARCYGQVAPLEFTGAAATKNAVRDQMSKCRYLHFSTHGFFAPPQVKSAADVNPRQNLGDMGEMLTRQDVSGYHPDLLSGLVLAGANRPVEDGQEDGILTALEVSGLDLSRVNLATLSACETGLGETAGGEGLLGLQRAFQLAGAKTTVASLWQVPDKATQLLMERFYDNLWSVRRPMSKLEALLEAQRWLLREGAKQSGLTRGLLFKTSVAATVETSGRLPPYYWAAFVLSGDWR
jgi:CHAT domain-containing protein/tetratricopeptide (TPR) repeat protein